jgi:hypothetical protein
MTRKDYELIAAAIKRQTATCDRFAVTPRGQEVLRSLLNDLASDLAGELAATNPRFDAMRFLKACGVNDV